MCEDLEGGRPWDFLEERVCGSVLNVTGSQSGSGKRAGLERRAGPALRGAWDLRLPSHGMWKLQRVWPEGDTVRQMVEWEEAGGGRPVSRPTNKPGGGA